MGKYTLRVEGQPIVDARELLAAAEGIHVSTGSALTVTVDAPTLEGAERLVRDALPSHGSYTVGRPDPIEDDER
ncbi:MAG: hypothetical protein ACXWDQ_01195 [Solirubrobacterales bacterium]